MMKQGFSAIGIIEISLFTNALIVLDETLKASDVRLISMEKKLGGRLVSIIIGGQTSAVQAAIDVAKGMGHKVGDKNIKIAITIPSPHPEIIKLIHKENKETVVVSQQPIKVSMTDNQKNIEKTEVSSERKITEETNEFNKLNEQKKSKQTTRKSKPKESNTKDLKAKTSKPNDTKSKATSSKSKEKSIKSKEQPIKSEINKESE